MPTPHNKVTVRQSLSCTEQTDLSPSGKVFVHGKLWEAESDQPVHIGEKVRVVEVEKSLKIKVKKEGT